MLIIIFAILLLCGIVYISVDREFAAIALSLITLIVMAGVVGNSYNNYLNLKALPSIIDQNKRAVEVYINKAKININNQSFTDLKYQKYQDNLLKLIEAYRDSVNKYNKLLIKQRILDKNIFFNWVTIGPDKDMHIIELKY